MRPVQLSLTVAVFFTAILTAEAAIPRGVSFQGILTDQTGNPRSDGAYRLGFKLYEVETGGTAVWSETQTVVVSAGIFRAHLGDSTALSLAFDKPYWLGITLLPSGTEQTPRVRISGAAYAIRASVADTAASVQTLQALAVSGDVTIGDDLQADTAVLKGVNCSGNATVTGSITTDSLAARSSRVGGGASTTPLSWASSGGVPGYLYSSPSGVAISDSLNDVQQSVFLGKGNKAISLFTKRQVRLRVDSTGNVGINTDTPAEKLTVSLGQNGFGKVFSAVGSSTPNERLYAQIVDANNSRLMSDNSNLQLFAGKAGQGVHINSANGNVGVGTVSPDSALTVERGLHVKGGALLNCLTYTTGCSSSDRRFKTDISPIDSALDKVQLLNGVTYTWDRQAHPERAFPEGQQIGLIAQEVETVLPQLVHTDSEGYKAVSYDKLTAVLVEGMKELREEVAGLREENRALRERLDRIER